MKFHKGLYVLEVGVDAAAFGVEEAEEVGTAFAVGGGGDAGDFAGAGADGGQGGGDEFAAGVIDGAGGLDLGKGGFGGGAAGGVGGGAVGGGGGDVAFVAVAEGEVDLDAGDDGIEAVGAFVAAEDFGVGAGEGLLDADLGGGLAGGFVEGGEVGAGGGPVFGSGDGGRVSRLSGKDSAGRSSWPISRKRRMRAATASCSATRKAARRRSDSSSMRRRSTSAMAPSRTRSRWYWTVRSKLRRLSRKASRYWAAPAAAQ